ncbi:MAG: hypothetical protein AVDCRST_MAG19-690, partial [uncultured Thermomicrobiales bacterium]
CSVRQRSSAPTMPWFWSSCARPASPGRRSRRWRCGAAVGHGGGRFGSWWRREPRPRGAGNPGP